ncbi:hypothetical protein [Actinacidiphila sp. bgisy144]|uniref:hypothetical protein n=1 Tax=Actinacidiphila sp. bgisy144 TaxID=3413791 RepID=UPI003EB7655E
MSVGDSGVRAFSMRLVLAWCQEHRLASSVTVRPAVRRRPLRRRATSSRAACADDDGDATLALTEELRAAIEAAPAAPSTRKEEPDVL